MAPEVAYCQYTSSSQLACPPTDYFSLGVIVYMMLSGGRSAMVPVVRVESWSWPSVICNSQGAILGRDRPEDPAEHLEEGGPVPSLRMEARLTGWDQLH